MGLVELEEGAWEAARPYPPCGGRRRLRGRHRPPAGATCTAFQPFIWRAGLAKGEMKQWGLRSGVRGNKPTRGKAATKYGSHTHQPRAGGTHPYQQLASASSSQSSGQGHVEYELVT